MTKTPSSQCREPWFNPGSGNSTSCAATKSLHANIWRLNNTLLNNQQIIEEIKKEIKIGIVVNENGNTMTQNLWDTVKAVLKGRIIALQAYLKKQEKKINQMT